jgi:hypothetical protein
MKALLKRRLAFEEEYQPSSKRCRYTSFHTDYTKSNNSNYSDSKLVLSIVERLTNQQTRNGLDGLPSDLCEHVIQYFGENSRSTQLKTVEEYLLSNDSSISKQKQQDEMEEEVLEELLQEEEEEEEERVGDDDSSMDCSEEEDSKLPDSPIMVPTWEDKELTVINHFNNIGFELGFTSHAVYRLEQEKIFDFAKRFRMVMNPTHPTSIQSWIDLYTPEKSGYIHLCTLKEFYQSLVKDKSIGSFIPWNDLEMQMKDMLGIFNLDNISVSRIRRSKLAGNVFKMFCIPSYLDTFNGYSGFRSFNYHEWIETQYTYLS